MSSSISSSYQFTNPTNMNDTIFQQLSDIKNVERVYSHYVLNQNNRAVLAYLLTMNDCEVMQDHAENFLKTLNLNTQHHREIADILIKEFTKEFTDDQIRIMVHQNIPAWDNNVNRLLKIAHQEENNVRNQKHLPVPHNPAVSLNLILQQPDLFSQKLNDPEFIYFYGPDLLKTAACLDSSIINNKSTVSRIIYAIRNSVTPREIANLKTSLEHHQFSPEWKAFILGLLN